VNRRPAAALVVLAIALLACVAWLLRRDDGGVDVAPTKPATVESPTVPMSAAVAPRRKHAIAEKPSETNDAVAADDDEPDGSPLFPALAVEVRRSDGSPATKGTAYALRPGGSVPSSPLVFAVLEADGTCVLRLPEPGVYDVGALMDDEFLSALATGVDSRTTPRVRLGLPAAAEIELDADETVPRGTLARLRIVSDDAGGWDRTFRAANLPLTIATVPGARFRLRSASAEVRFVPDRVTAPGTATLNRDERGRVRLRVTVVPENRVARHDAVLHTEFEIEGGGAVGRWDELSRDWIAASGVRLSDTFRSRDEWVVSVPAPRGILRWHGAGVASGSVGFEAPDGETVDVPVTLKLDDTLPGEAECTVRIDGPADARDVTLWIVGADGEGSTGRSAAAGAEVVVTAPPWSSAFVCATADGLATAAAHFDAARPLVLTLPPAGYLCVFRGIRPPEQVDLVLRRKDGRPFPYEHYANQPQHVVSLKLTQPSFVVGPLPEGDVTFVVSCAGRDLAEATAHVVAGTTTDVRLPLAERLGAAKR
jgi:hypothetical protein